MIIIVRTILFILSKITYLLAFGLLILVPSITHGLGFLSLVLAAILGIIITCIK